MIRPLLNTLSSTWVWRFIPLIDGFNPSGHQQIFYADREIFVPLIGFWPSESAFFVTWSGTSCLPWSQEFPQ